MVSFGFKKNRRAPKVDLHSHLIPGIDDGVKTIDDAVNIILAFKELGYVKVITTPHIHPKYPNGPTTILDGLLRVQNELQARSIDFEIEAAAEYYVDESFLEMLKSDQDILSFGERYVLVESSFLNKPMYFESCLFDLKAKGYQPILAHPERYQFLEGQIDWLLSLKEMGILFQVTISSFSGFYGSAPQYIAKKLYKESLIDFLGSDMHNESHLTHFKKGLKRREVENLFKSPSLGNLMLL